MAKTEQEKDRHAPTIKNRRASFEYTFIDTYQCGIVLQGTEVKSIRAGKVQLQDAFCTVRDGALWLINCEISPYEHGNVFNHEAKRARKLLLKAREVRKLETASITEGLTIIPTKLYFNTRGLAKLEVALAKGKKLYDKRESIKSREVQRDLQRGED